MLLEVVPYTTTGLYFKHCDFKEITRALCSTARAADPTVASRLAQRLQLASVQVDRRCLHAGDGFLTIRSLSFIDVSGRPVVNTDLL